MSIFNNLNRRRKPDRKAERVPVFVLHPSSSLDSMEFYAFHKMFSPIFDDDCTPSPDEGIRAVPFTGVSSCPRFCSFISFKGALLVVGGTRLSDHLRRRVFSENPGSVDVMGVVQEALSVEEILKIVKEEYPSERLRSVPPQQLIDIVTSHSDRTRAFLIQSFVDNKEKKQIEFCDLDEDTAYWKSYATLHMPRIDFQLLSAGEVVYAFGGDDDCQIMPEAFVDGQWFPVHIVAEMEDLDCFVSAAVRNIILIGSFGSTEHGSFTALRLLDNGDKAKPRLLFIRDESVSVDDIECPEDFVVACSNMPGIVVDDQSSWDEMIVVWHDRTNHCIRGLHLGHKQHFKIDLVEESILVPDCDDLHNAKNLYYARLIGFGDGTLAMIYTGTERYLFVDDQGEIQHLSDYRCVAFEIIYDHSDYSARVPFPGIPVKTRLISNRKCYAPLSMELRTAFLMDVCLPEKLEHLSLSSIDKTVGLHTILR